MLLKLNMCAVGVAFLAASFGANAQQYSVTDLGTLGGSTSYGTGINATGQVAGTSSTASGNWHAFVYANGTMEDLGTLGTSLPESWGYGINAIGQVTGYSYISFGNYNLAHAFLYGSGAMQDLGTLGGSIDQSWGYAINASGQVTGESDTANVYIDHAFLYSSGTMQDIGTLGGPTTGGFGLNNSGQVTGVSQIASDNNNHAFLYNSGNMQDLGTLGGPESFGTAINASGQVTGDSTPAGSVVNHHAFLYSNGTMLDLGTLGGPESSGLAINASGQVTGISDTPTFNDAHAFLYSNDQMVDLNTFIGSAASIYLLSYGNAINDAGQIVVNAIVNATGDTHALILTPTNAIATSTRLTTWTHSLVYGSPLTLTALVTARSGAAPAGTVTFYAGSAYLGTVILNSTGQAVLTTSALPVGFEPITAIYSGNSPAGSAPDLGSGSAAVNVKVRADSTRTVLAVMPSTADGAALTLTATVNPTDGPAVPAGTVTFMVGTTTLGTATLNGSGVATFTTAPLVPGKYPIGAEYAGTTNDRPSKSPTVTVTIY